MTDSSSYGVGLSISLTLLFAAIGYFVYGGLNGAFAMAILYILYGFAALLSCIPFFGIGIQYWVSMEMVLPWVISLTGIQPTWLTTVMLGYQMVLGLIIWIFVIIRIWHYFEERRWWRKKTAYYKNKKAKLSETPAETGNNQ